MKLILLIIFLISTSVSAIEYGYNICIDISTEYDQINEFRLDHAGCSKYVTFLSEEGNEFMDEDQADCNPNHNECY